MGLQAPLDLKNLVARRKAGHALEAPFYRSPEIYALDLELIFARHWIFVANEAEVPEAGDFVKVDLGPESIVIVRDDDEVVRAFHNVCRHRGSRLVTEPRGTLGKLVCPYHQWTYELDGRLIRASQMGPDFDFSCHGLKPAHLRSVGGLLFVCLADEPPTDIDDLAAVMEPRLAPFDLRHAKVAHQDDLIEGGNWKLTMENNRECYHCDASHPELCLSFSKFSVAYEPDADNPDDVAQAEAYHAEEQRLLAQWESAGFPSRAVEHLTGRPTGFRTQRFVIAGAGESFTMDTRAASRKLLGDLTDAKLGDLHMHLQPNGWFHFMADHAITFSVIPLDAEHTLVRSTWLVHRDAVEGRDYDLDRLTEVWKATNRQDGSLVELAQQGVRTRAYTPGPYSPQTEDLCEQFATWYIERMAAGLA